MGAPTAFLQSIVPELHPLVPLDHIQELDARLFMEDNDLFQANRLSNADLSGGSSAVLNSELSHWANSLP